MLSQKGAFSEFLKEHILDIEDEDELLELQKEDQLDKDIKVLLEKRLSDAVDEIP